MSDLEIFQIAGAIALALKGEKEAIADVELLLKRHPEMFENAKDVVNTINKVVSEPEIIMDNPSVSKYKSKNEVLSAKKLDDKKIELELPKKAHVEILDSNMPFDMSSMQESLNKMLGSLNKEKIKNELGFTVNIGISSILSSTG